jgi:hypothetical protein
MRGTNGNSAIRQFTYHVLKPDGREQEHVTTLAQNPSADEIRKVVRRYMDGAPEHVSILRHDRRADMFVDEDSHLKRLPRNEGATALFRAVALNLDPGRDPETLPFIAGPAVLFDDVVWAQD